MDDLLKLLLTHREKNRLFKETVLRRYLKNNDTSVDEELFSKWLDDLEKNKDDDNKYEEAVKRVVGLEPDAVLPPTSAPQKGPQVVYANNGSRVNMTDSTNSRSYDSTEGDKILAQAQEKLAAATDKLATATTQTNSRGHLPQEPPHEQSSSAQSSSPPSSPASSPTVSSAPSSSAPSSPASPAPSSPASSPPSGSDKGNKTADDPPAEEKSNKIGNKLGAAASAAMGDIPGALAKFLNSGGNSGDKKEKSEKKKPDGSSKVGHPVALILFAAIVGLVYSIFVYNITYIGIAVAVLLAFSLSPEFRREFWTTSGFTMLLVLIAHGIYMQAGFKVDVRTVLFIVAIYVPIVVLTILFAKDNGERMSRVKTSFFIIILTLLIYSLPAIVTKYLSNANAGYANAMVYLAAIAPLWFLYELQRTSTYFENGWSEGIFFWYKLLAIAGIVILFGVYGVLQLQEALPNSSFGSVDTTTGLKGFWETVTSTFDKVTKRLKTSVDQATNPGAYYTSTVDETKDKELGVTIEARAADNILSESSEVVVYGSVTAKSFMSSSVFVDTSCLIDRKGAPEGRTRPEKMEVIYGTSPQFTCTMPPLKKGSYNVRTSATFDFQTWVYLPVTIVDEERARAIASQGVDLRQKLEINPTPTAVYTQGPLIVGMGGSDQPVLISPEKDMIIPAGMTVGMTLEPGWQQGELRSVSTMELKVPKPFKLEKCTRPLAREPEQDTKDEAYTSYLFDTNANLSLVTATSITCALAVDKSDRDAARLLASEGDKVTRSFIGVVNYRYTVKDDATVTVK